MKTVGSSLCRSQNGVESGEWEWRVGSGEWGVGSGEWGMGKAAERKTFIHYNHFDGILENFELKSNINLTQYNHTSSSKPIYWIRKQQQMEW